MHDLQRDSPSRRLLSCRPFPKCCRTERSPEAVFPFTASGIFSLHWNSTSGNRETTGSREAGGFVNHAVNSFVLKSCNLTITFKRVFFLMIQYQDIDVEGGTDAPSLVRDLERLITQLQVMINTKTGK